MELGEPRKQSNHQLWVIMDEKTKEIHIEGNKAGLEYLAAVCLKVAQQTTGANHWHLGEVFHTLAPKSLDLIVCHRQKSGDISGK